MRVGNALAVAVMLAVPLAANAQPITGLYVGAGAGANLLQNQNVSATAGGGTIPSAGKYHIGPVAEISLGWGFGNGLRAEVEGDFYNNTGSHQSTGDEDKYGAMVNALYDFNVVPWVTPYVGAGVGYQAVTQNHTAFTAPLTGGPAKGDLLTYRRNGFTQGAFAYQAIAGLAIPVPDVPGLAVTAEYRFMGLAGDRDFGGSATLVGVGSLPVTYKSNPDNNHSFLIGVRYAFGAAPAPAPVAPAPSSVAPSPVSRSYIVFFDWDKADLTERARQIVAEAAKNSTGVQYTKIEVNGYTDTSGTAAYNQGLSVRRAQAVAVELVKDGVPKAAIAIQGFGETHPLVPTGVGVREPQNRRVEIIIK